MINFGEYRETTSTQDTYDFFLNEIEKEYNYIWVYFTDLKEFLDVKKEKIENELKNENAEIKLSILNQPNYSLYENKFEDILYKSLIITLISNFENNLHDLINILIKEKVIKSSFEKPRNNIINSQLDFLYTNFNVKPTEPYYCNSKLIHFFVILRNSIVHHSSTVDKKILQHSQFKYFKDLIILENNKFMFKDITIIHHLLKLSRTYFNSFSYFIK